MASFLVTMLITVLAVHEERAEGEAHRRPSGPPMLRLVALTAIFVAVTPCCRLAGGVRRTAAGPGRGTAQVAVVGLAGLVGMAGAIFLGVCLGPGWASAQAARQHRFVHLVGDQPPALPGGRGFDPGLCPVLPGRTSCICRTPPR